MSRYLTTKARKSDSAPMVPVPPECCGYYGCTEPTGVLVAVVREGDRTRAGGFYDFGNGHGMSATLRPGFSWVSWVARCQHHYLRDLYAAGRGVWSGVNPTGVPTIDDYRRLRGSGGGAGTASDGGRDGEEGPNLARDPRSQSGSGGPDSLAESGGDRNRGGDLERDELDDWRTGTETDWPFDDDAGADRGMAGVQ